MATPESDDELFEAALRDVEEAAKPQPKKKPTASKSQTELKREKLIELPKDGTVRKSASFIRKANKGVVENCTMTMRRRECHLWGLPIDTHYLKVCISLRKPQRSGIIRETIRGTTQ
jgi:hypothetical protein